METFLVNQDRSIPANPDAGYAGQFAKAGVTPDTHRLLVESVTSSVPPPTPTTNATLASATKTVAAAGTPEVLGSGTCLELFIYPLRTNTGAVYWGTEATNDTQNGLLPVIITAPDGKLISLASIYIDVAVNGEGVRYVTKN